VAKRLGTYDLRLLHRSVKTHFIGIADGLSQSLTRLLTSHIAEDVEGPRPVIGYDISAVGLATNVAVNSGIPVPLWEEINSGLDLEEMKWMHRG